MELLGIREVRLSSRFIDDVTLWNAAPGTGIEIIDVEVGHLTYVQKGASEADSTADSLTVDLKAFLVVFHPDPDRYSFGPSGEVHVETLTAHGVEILEIGSYATTNTNLSFSEFTNTITDIQGDSITTLRLRGHSQLEISNFPDTVTTIDAGADFFSDGVNDYPIAVVGGGSGHQGVFVFIDVSGDGDFDIWSELIIQVLAGDIDASSFAVV